MTAPIPDPPPPSPHRAARGSAWGAVGRLLGVQFAAVIGVTAVITGVYALTGPHHDHSADAVADQPSGTSAPTTHSPAPSTAAPTSSSPAPTTPTPTTTASDRVAVDVLNQSAGRGAAARVARHVRAAGWPVGRVDNFNGNISTTTLYYPKGHAAEAHRLARAVPGQWRVLPRDFSSISRGRFTVILVD